MRNTWSARPGLAWVGLLPLVGAMRNRRRTCPGGPGSTVAAPRRGDEERDKHRVYFNNIALLPLVGAMRNDEVGGGGRPDGALLPLVGAMRNLPGASLSQVQQQVAAPRRGDEEQEDGRWYDELPFSCCPS